jgi:transposase
VKLQREQDVEIRLRQAAMILEKENERLVQENVALQRRLLALEGKSPEELQTRLAVLEQQFAAMRDRMFGPSSEKRPTAAEPREATPQTGHGPREQPQLRIAHVIHVLDEADMACPKCGKQLEEFEGQHEESEEIDVIAREFVVRRHHRQKYRCSCNGHIETAPGPMKLFPGSRYSIDFAIEVAAAKYVDHAPLERQVRTMAREGLVIDSQTLWDVIERLARIVKDLPETIAAHILTSAVVGADETRWRMLDGNGRDGGEAKNWQVWTLASPNAVAYRIEDSRSVEAADKLLGGYAGVVMADGYGAYEALRKRGGKFTLAHCWAHVRRKYVEVESFFPNETKQILDLIGELYAIERICPTGPPGDELRRKLRHERSREVMSRIHAWALETRALPQSGLSKAIAYMTGLWPGLVRFLEDPRIPIDNNASERALRGVVVGRKNHYGSKSRRGTEVAALYYTILETAKLAGIDPKAYLRRAVHAVFRGERMQLPHELAASVAA